MEIKTKILGTGSLKSLEFTAGIWKKKKIKMITKGVSTPKVYRSFPKVRVGNIKFQLCNFSEINFKEFGTVAKQRQTK